MSSFPSQPLKPDFSDLQQQIIAFWEKKQIFEQSVAQHDTSDSWRFYDGPPFPTGFPHYGHLSSSVAKDVLPRYHTMMGKRVERVRGWDCHGIPVEQKVQKDLWRETRAEIEKNGLEQFTAWCHRYVGQINDGWKRYITQFGRWVDYENSYKTMDDSYIESVFWVFKTLWDKGLIYKGKRVSMYSTKLSTPISNFEVAMDNSYQDVNDPAITVTFELKKNKVFDEKHLFLLARTTTPRTIPANMWLAVNKNMKYALVSCDHKYFVVAANLVEKVFLGKEYTTIQTISGAALIWLSYHPPFDYFVGDNNPAGANERNHTIYHGDFVDDSSGTGIVHTAPEFGESDFYLGKEQWLTLSDALDMEGHYTSQIKDFVWVYYRDAQEDIIKHLADKGVLFKKESITHRVAFCPRSDVPLIYKAQDSWFIDVQSLKPRLLDANKQINRYPAQDPETWRFAQNIKDAPDRCISRTRYRGTPMPLWREKKTSSTKHNPDEIHGQKTYHEDHHDDHELLVVGSREEIFTINKAHKQLTKIILVRHGRTDYNEKKRWDSEGKAQLTELGLQQAQKIAELYKETDIDAIYSSPLSRCQATITPLADQTWLDIQTDTRLREVVAPHVQDQPFDCGSISRNDDPIGGDQWESIKDVFGRVQEFLHEVAKKHAGETIVICSHGDPLVLLRKAMRDFDYDTDKSKHYINNHAGDIPSHVTYIWSDKKRCGKELELHRPYIDELMLTHPVSGAEMERVEEVLDGWMDSASMPYGQMHYPFTDKEKFEAMFPGDFIVEYTWQIRAWFYVMHVLGVALFDKPAFLNCITHGIVRGNDGRKMSKSLGNFPDPKPTFEAYGWDTVRMNILSSPLFAAWDTAITDEWFRETYKVFLAPLWNAFSFFVTYANIDKRTPDSDIRPDGGVDAPAVSHFLDRWIIGELQTLTHEIQKELENYRLEHATRPLAGFLDNLTNWYIRRSRRRFWKAESDSDKNDAYKTLYYVLVTLSQVCAPFMPFVTEHIYKALVERA